MLKRRRTHFLVLLSLLCPPALAWASGGGGAAHHGGWDWKLVAFAFFNFALFFAGLLFFLRKPLREFLTQRRGTLADALAEAAKLHAEADARLRDLQAKLQNLDAEREAILAAYRREGDEEKARLTEAGRKAADGLRRELTFLLEQEALLLRKQLRSHAVDGAVALAERLVRADLTPQDQVRLVDEYIQKLGSVEPPARH